MFTGIIETLGTVSAVRTEDSNVHFTITSPISGELKIDQSVAHNGVCLTVIACDNLSHTVTAIAETLNRTNLSGLQQGDRVNLERCVPAHGRLDGHIVQGHVDTVGECIGVENLNGSWKYYFRHPKATEFVTVPKGSICVNGVSLTVVDSTENTFSVAIIPYTYEHTTFQNIQIGSSVNLEFDIVGKYIATLYHRQKN
ncbi:MAG: riboflavin synthase [Bacteroidetes bacterium]|jgi:riboflavin synthase|nr:riboflavin synthase [Bacteroidota bacterium]